MAPISLFLPWKKSSNVFDHVSSKGKLARILLQNDGEEEEEERDC